MITAIRILHFSSKYYEIKSDVAIVLGAGIENGNVTPVFQERLNHAKYLFENKKVDFIIVTGGFGHREMISDSQAGLAYLISHGVPRARILIDQHSKFTFQNLKEAKKLMESKGLNQALLVSDPMHMMRAMALTETLGIFALPSPTQTSMFRSFMPKLRFLLYETFFYLGGEILFYH